MISSDKYGSDKSTLPRGIANFIYGSKTGNSNLRRHLLQVHTEEYDKAVVQHKWAYKLSTKSRNVSTQIARNQCGQEVPLFSPGVFLEHLTHFIRKTEISLMSYCVLIALKPKFSLILT